MGVKPRESWTARFSYEESITILEDLALEHAKEAGPFRERLESILGRRDWAALLAFEFDYGAEEYLPLHLFHARQSVGLFKKFEPLRIAGVSKAEAALSKFVQAEARCRNTNARFRDLWKTSPNFWVEPVGRALLRARRKISKILGPVPTLDRLDFRYGPGATTSIQKSGANPRVKLGAPLTCSKEFAAAPASLLREVPLLLDLHCSSRQYASQLEELRQLLLAEDRWFVELHVVPGKLQFVPKNALTYRSIIIEPTLNGLFQQGVGRWFKKRLLKYGVDLKDQTRNQRMALLGSVTNHLATFDFSSASDLISKELVAWFLPEDWFELLSVLRTGSYTFSGSEPQTLEKFSSMGNSFTFELESVIFYALTEAVCHVLHLPTDEITVFGDDVVAPSSAQSLLMEVFDFCGFEVNSKKSFWSGPFRESCGKDYYKGFDIRPVHPDDMLSAQALFVLHNFYMRCGEFRFADKVKGYIHPNLLIFGPDGYGDGHLIGSWRGRSKKEDRRRGWEGVWFHTFRLRPREQNKFSVFPGDTVLPAYKIYVGPDEDDDGQPAKVIEIGLRVKGKPYGYMPKACLTLPGSSGYERISIYTLACHVFPKEHTQW